MDIVVIQHEPHITAGLLGEVLELRGRPTRTLRMWQSDPVPSGVAGIRALAVLGGTMNTDEAAEHPFLEAERALLAACVEAAVPVLGLCLGAQLLAEATGGSVTHRTAEHAYVPVRRADAADGDEMFAGWPDGAAGLSLHADWITAGPDSVVLASSEHTPVEAFRVGDKAYGVQFHPEFDAAALSTVLAGEGARDRLAADGVDPDLLLEDAVRRDPFQRATGAGLLGRWVDGVVGRTDAEQPWGRRGPQPVPGPGLSLNPA